MLPNRRPRVQHAMPVLLGSFLVPDGSALAQSGSEKVSGTIKFRFLTPFLAPRLVRFEPPGSCASDAEARDQPEPGTFDFLGFTHYWGGTRRGGWVVKRKTAKSRLQRALHALSEWCRENRHEPIGVQHRTLCQKLRGHYGYYGIIGNFFSLQKFLEGARQSWRRWLSRRRRAGRIPWPAFLRLEQRYELPRARVVHGLASGAAK